MAHPKFYFIDVGIYRTLRPKGPLDLPEEIQGAAFETLFFQELNAVNDYLDLGYKMFYWRSSNNAEVDFVLYGNRGIRAFEVKSAGKITRKMFSGLKAFAADYPSAKSYLVYAGKRRMREGKIEILPVLEALKNLSSILS